MERKVERHVNKDLCDQVKIVVVQLVSPALPAAESIELRRFSVRNIIELVLASFPA